MGMAHITDHTNVKATPQTSPIPGSTQVPNSGGGFSWAVDDWTRLTRFLILGSEGGSFYASEKALTLENAKVVANLVQADGLRVVREAVAVSTAGRAVKNTPAVFALALAAKTGDKATRTAAYAALPQVCRIGTHLFEWAEAISSLSPGKGFSSGAQRAVTRWYESRDADGLAHQLAKYQQRNGWSHRDLLRLAKIGAKTRRGSRDSAGVDAALTWATKGTLTLGAPALLVAFERAKELGLAAPTPDSIRELVQLIAVTNLPRECVPSNHLNSPEVWEALLDNGGRGMPPEALVRNLAKMTSVGLLAPMSAAILRVEAILGNGETLHKARLHPLKILTGLRTYAAGRGVLGSLTWNPVARVIDVLDAAFYLSFKNVEPTGKRTLLCLDVSGSMSGASVAGLAGLSAREASAAMALVTMTVEPQCEVMAFSRGFMPVAISPRQRLDDVIRTISDLPFEATDCSVPMRWAEQHKIAVDTFQVYTDSETNVGRIHPAQALRHYRAVSGVDARLAVVAMASNGFTIADPNDRGMLDVVGFDTATPEVLAAFSKGEL